MPRPARCAMRFRCLGRCRPDGHLEALGERRGRDAAGAFPHTHQLYKEECYSSSQLLLVVQVLACDPVHAHAAPTVF